MLEDPGWSFMRGGCLREWSQPEVHLYHVKHNNK